MITSRVRTLFVVVGAADSSHFYHKSATKLGNLREITQRHNVIIMRFDLSIIAGINSALTSSTTLPTDSMILSQVKVELQFIKTWGSNGEEELWSEHPLSSLQTLDLITMPSHTKRFQNGVYFSAWRSARYWELSFAYLLLFCVQTNFVE